MKKVIKKLYQGILKYKKKTIYVALAVFIGQICFFNLGGIGVQNEAFAQTQGSVSTNNGTATQDQTAKVNVTKRSEHLAFRQKVVYVLIYPMMVVAGKLADNSFVYGEVFGFDALLRNLWNIVRNLANFALGFIFVYKLFEYLLKDKSGDIKKLLIQSLLAGIGIQASWFIMAALIDISTVLTYGIGGLPISVLGGEISDKNDNNPYMLKNVIEIEADNLTDYKMYLTSTKDPGSYYISQCKTFTYASGSSSEELILAPSTLYYKEKSGANVEIKKTDSNRCHYYGQVYYFGIQSSYVTGERIECVETCNNCNNKCSDIQAAYDSRMTDAISKIQTGDTIVEYIRDGRILEIGDAHVTGGVISIFSPPIMYDVNDQYGLDKDNERTGTGGTTDKLENILQGNSYVGVFTSLYSSLMNSGKGILPSDAGLFPGILNLALSLGHLIAIGIPLIIVAIIFMMRIGILRIAIAISPFIALLTAFKDLGDKVFKDGEFLEYFKLGNLIPIIFSPAIICFAISMSTVLVVIISKINVDPIQGSDASIWGGLITMKIGNVTIPLGKIVISILGIAVTWFIVWAAVETSKLGKSKIVQSLKQSAETALGSIPIVPIPSKDGSGIDFIGMNAAKQAPQILENSVQKSLNSDVTALEELFDPDKAREKAEEAKEAAEKAKEEAKIKAYTDNITSLSSYTNWINQEIDVGNNEKLIFSTINDVAKQEKIIEGINNINDANIRDKLGTAAPSITIGQGQDAKTYEFNTQNSKYEPK